MKRKMTPLYRVAQVVVPIFYALYSPMIIRRAGPLPEGRMVICSNHLSFSDPLYIGMTQKRQVFYMAKAELFRSRFLNWLLRALGAFPVERGTGDTGALKSARDILQADEILGIFIEGTRSKTGELLRPKTGAVMLAYQTNAPIVPLCITAIGCGKIRPFHKVCVSFGEVIPPDQLGITEGTSAEFRRASRMVMDRIASLRARDIADFEKGTPCSIQQG